MTPAQENDIRTTVQTLTLLRVSEDPAEIERALTRRAIETGGFYKPAAPGNTWDSQRVEITLHGIFGQGEDLDEAVRNWLRAARATLGHGKDAA